MVLPLTIYPHERIIRILKLIEEKQNGRCISCKQRITNDHVVVSSGRPRHYYHRDCAIKHIVNIVISNHAYAWQTSNAIWALIDVWICYTYLSIKYFLKCYKFDLFKQTWFHQLFTCCLDFTCSEMPGNFQG